MRGFVSPWPVIGLDATEVRTRLGTDAYDAAWRAGERLGISTAVAEMVR
jgi:hypothetical protein